jgi:tetratricopeptide (TPR) repeat protein
MLMKYACFKNIIAFKIFILFLLLFSFNTFAEISLSIYPTPIVAGEESNLIINSSEGKAEIKELPKVKGLRWLNTNSYSKNIMIINGVKYIKTSYPFIIKTPGRVNLPSMTVSIEGGKDITTAEKEVLVSTGPLSDLESLLYMKCTYPKKKRSYYVGEDVPLKINIYRALDLKADPVEYPQIKMDNIIFDNFKENKQSDKFAPYPYGSPAKVTNDGIDYIETTFYTSFRPLSDGILRGGTSLTFNIQLKSSSRSSGSSPFDDDLFGSNSMFSGSFFNRNKFVTRIITAKIPKIEVKPLPPIPAKSNYLGLIGDWKIKENINYEKLKEGEPVTVSLDITGLGSLETLNVPDINVPGFNVYSPEVIKQENGYGEKQSVKIDYVLIPTEPGKSNLNLSFSIFDTKFGKYKTVKIKKTLEIKKGDGESVKSIYSSSNMNISKKKNKVSNSILYIKIHPGSSMEVPLYKNFLFTIVFLLLVGPTVWILFELFCFRKKYITGKDGFKRRSKAAKKRKSILKSVKNSSDMKELADTVQKEVIPYINDMKGFPPGTTVEGLEKVLKDKEITEALKDSEASAYIPSNEDNSDELKKKIIRIIKHFSMFVIACGVIFMTSNNTFGNDTFGNDTASLESNSSEFTALYNNGKFDQALKICKDQINLSAPNPDWLYNLGNCYFQKGDLAKAMVCYERALRLMPRDSDILENLNFVRRKLFLPEVYQTNAPIELVKFIRDYLRPDEWLLIFCIGWFMIFTSLIIRRVSLTRVWFISCSVAVVLCIISSAAYISETTSLYNSKNAVVVERNVKVFSLPTKDSPDAGFTLNSGDSVKIQENVQNWIRVRKGKTEGWINTNKAEQVWPY